MRVNVNKLGIREVFEIRLAAADWLRISEVAVFHDLSYSWIVRRCIFRYLKNKPESSHIGRVRGVVKNKIKNNSEMHRHMLCLYGEDALMIRVIAADLGISVNMLVRLAVQENLEDLMHVGMDIGWMTEGIKLVKKFEIGDLYGIRLGSDMENHTRFLQARCFFPTELRPMQFRRKFLLK